MAVAGARGTDRVDVFDWDEFYRSEYVAAVRLAGLLLGDYQAGEDVAQEAFARLLEAKDKAGDPQSYVRGIVVNVCRSRIRRAIVVRRHDRTQRRDDPGYGDTADSVGQRIVVHTALLGLPVRQRAAVVLRFYVGLGDADIAAVMGVSVGSVKTHLHRGLASLSTLLDEQI